MKKIYQNPETIVAELSQETIIADSVRSIKSNSTGLVYGGGGSTAARTKEQTWDDWSEE